MSQDIAAESLSRHWGSHLQQVAGLEDRLAMAQTVQASAARSLSSLPKVQETAGLKDRLVEMQQLPGLSC